MLNLPPTIILFDTEYTTWKGAPERQWNGPGEHRELVQIGAIKVDTRTLREIERFEIFIKPRINPTLSDFFIELTGISQGTVDTEGVEFADAWKSFTQWLGNDDAYSFGNNDTDVIKENCLLSNTLFNLPESQFKNICDVFEKYGIDTNKYHSSTITRAFGKEPRQGAHNALNDTRSILDGLILLEAKLTAA